MNRADDRRNVSGGRIVSDAPVDWPDGTRVEIDRASCSEMIGIDESEWRDDAESLAAWKTWIETEEAEMESFAAKMREYDIEAVRR